MFKLILCCLAVSGISSAQKVYTGRCPNVNVVQNFNLTRYIGEWFEYERTFFFREYKNRCVTATYSVKDDGHVKVVNRGVNMDTGVIDTSTGDAVAPNASAPAKLTVRFGDVGPPGFYWVLDTDYTTFAVVWSCIDVPTGLSHSEITWILSRNQAGVSDDRRDKIYALLKGENIDTTQFSKVNHTNCPI